MSTTATTTRHLRILWRGEKPWHWLALMIGHVQPLGYRTYIQSRFLWQFHVTPIHLYRDSSGWEAGLCLGKRTIYLRRHR
jgi:hypothetical protein